MQIIIISMSGVIILLLLAILLILNKNKNSEILTALQESFENENEKTKEQIKNFLDVNNQKQYQLLTDSQKNQTDILLKIQETNQNQNQKNSDFFNNQLEKMLNFQTTQAEKTNRFQSAQFESLLKNNTEQQKNIITIIQSSLEKLQNSNEEKLDKIQGVVNEKLDKTLNERLDSNFKQIGDSLGELYKSLGELNKLSTGVIDLNKTLSNVKTRGTWGEIQLKSILEQTMVNSQYDINVATKKNSNDRVEFAIKIPSREDNNTFIYLPIDSKMPSDIYNKIVDASATSNQDLLNAAYKELEQRIKTEARTIRDKYIDPPNTTDFAIMFLPTEGLYAEALRINGLAEWCQSNCKIVISGPTTITALLNSLRLGFSNMALTKKSQEVLKLLQAIKTQYQTFNELIEKTQKKLHEAVSSTDKLKERTEIIQRRMAKVEQLDLKEADDLLEIKE